MLIIKSRLSKLKMIKKDILFIIDKNQVMLKLQLPWIIKKMVKFKKLMKKRSNNNQRKKN